MAAFILGFPFCLFLLRSHRTPHSCCIVTYLPSVFRSLHIHVTSIPSLHTQHLPCFSSLGALLRTPFVSSLRPHSILMIFAGRSRMCRSVFLSCLALSWSVFSLLKKIWPRAHSFRCFMSPDGVSLLSMLVSALHVRERRVS